MKIKTTTSLLLLLSIYLYGSVVVVDKELKINNLTNHKPPVVAMWLPWLMFL